MFVFLAISIQMWHCIRDKLTDYWAMTDQFYIRFYNSAMKKGRYFHILRFLHFIDNKNVPDMTDENTDRLWKMRNLFEILNEKFSKILQPFWTYGRGRSNCIVHRKGHSPTIYCISKKHKRFGIKLYKLIWRDWIQVWYDNYQCLVTLSRTG